MVTGLTVEGHSRRGGFSLSEMLIVIMILSFITLLMASLFEAISHSLVRSKDQVKQFSDARLAFEYLTRNVEQATLNTYLDYHYTGEEDSRVPEGYTAQSDLHFKVDDSGMLLGAEGGEGERFQTHCVFFQAPLGASNRYVELKNLLNARGYFVEFGGDEEYRPDFLGNRRVEPRYRFRLKEFRPPGEFNWIYKELQSTGDSGEIPEFTEWFRADSTLYDTQPPYHTIVRNVAENVVGIIVSPRVSEADAEAMGYQDPAEFAPYYRYDSRLEFPSGNDLVKTVHQLPPLMKVILITISEKSAVQLQDRYGQNVPPELRVEPGWFEDSLKLEEDLEAFEQQLRKAAIEYRTFQTTIKMQAAKWRNEV